MAGKKITALDAAAGADLTSPLFAGAAAAVTAARKYTPAQIATAGGYATLAGFETLSNKTLNPVFGSLGSPSIFFGSDTSTGIFRGAANTVSIQNSSTETLRVTATGVNIASTASLGLGGASAPTVILHRDASDVLALRRDANSQTLRLYNTFTDTSNYERLAISQTAAAVNLIAETAGTGTDNRNISLLPSGTGNVSIFRPSADGIAFAPGAAGAGVTASVLNNAITDFEPLTFNAETFTLGIRNGAGTVLTKFAVNNTGIAFFAGTPTAQPAVISAFTDNTGGTATSTFANLPTLADAPITADNLREDLMNNWHPVLENYIASISAKINQLSSMSRGYGLCAAA